MSRIYVRVKPKEPAAGTGKSLNRNVIQVGVSYVKGHGIVVSAYPGERHRDGAMIEITSGERISVERLTRNSKKKVEVWEKVADEQVKAKAGVAWDLVAMLLRRFNLELDES